MEFDRCFLFSRLKSCTMHSSLKWVLQKLLKPTTASYQAPYQSMLLLDQDCMTQRLPCKASQAGAPYPSPYCTGSGTERGQAAGGPTMQPPTASSLRSHPDSLYVPCTRPECCLANTNPSVQVGPEGLSNLGSPQHPLPLFIRGTAFQ